MCFKLQTQYSVEISKQGLDQRFNQEAVSFLKAALSLRLSKQMSNGTLNCWDHFKSVKIKDSTRFTAPETLSGSYPSHGSGGHKAGLSIAYEFDIKSGKVIDLSVHPSIRQDHVDAKESMAAVKPRELLIRDLGFISVDVLSQIQDKGAFFINRLHTNTLIYEERSGKFVKMDYAKMHRLMKAHNIDRLERRVYIGDQKKLPVRMILELLPDGEVEKKLRKMKHRAKRNKWNLSKEYRHKACFNLFVTNVEPSVIPGEKIRDCYRLRWQVELMFKVWKSNFQIHRLKPMNEHRYQCHLYAKLLWVVITKHIFNVINLYSWKRSNRLMSFMKTFSHLNNSIHSLEASLIKGKTQHLRDQLTTFFRFAIKHLHLEEKKNKTSLSQLLKDHIQSLSLIKKRKACTAGLNY